MKIVVQLLLPLDYGLILAVDMKMRQTMVYDDRRQNKRPSAAARAQGGKGGIRDAEGARGIPEASADEWASIISATRIFHPNIDYII